MKNEMMQAADADTADTAESLPVEADDDDSGGNKATRRMLDSTRRSRIGVCLVMLVALLYVSSGVAIQLLFDELEFEKPFFFSYTSVMLCSCYLLQAQCWQCVKRVRQRSGDHAYSHLYGLTTTVVSSVHKPASLLRPALLLAPAYFALNYTYFLSLDLTSVSETMILSASTGLWTLLFSRLVLREPVKRMKLLAVLVSGFGICLVTYCSTVSVVDKSQPSEHEATNSTAGNVLALLSAVSSGIYVVLLRALVPSEEEVHMPSLFGMIGLTASCCFAPLFPLLHFTGVEQFELPQSRSAVAALLLNAFLSTVLPDMLLAQAVVMTSPLLATLGLSLMIPLSVIADYARGLAHVSPGFYAGTLLVFVGFQLESFAETDSGEADERDGSGSDVAMHDTYVCGSVLGAASQSKT